MTTPELRKRSVAVVAGDVVIAGRQIGTELTNRRHLVRVEAGRLFRRRDDGPRREPPARRCPDVLVLILPGSAEVYDAKKSRGIGLQRNRWDIRPAGTPPRAVWIRRETVAFTFDECDEPLSAFYLASKPTREESRLRLEQISERLCVTRSERLRVLRGERLNFIPVGGRDAHLRLGANRGEHCADTGEQDSHISIHRRFANGLRRARSRDKRTEYSQRLPTASAGFDEVV